MSFNASVSFSSQVKDLKDALEERGLDSKGVKAVLKERLMEALAKENAAAASNDGAEADDGAASDADAASDGEKENVDVAPKEKIAESVEETPAVETPAVESFNGHADENDDMVINFFPHFPLDRHHIRMVL